MVLYILSIFLSYITITELLSFNIAESTFYIDSSNLDNERRICFLENCFKPVQYAHVFVVLK